MSKETDNPLAFPLTDGKSFVTIALDSLFG